MLGVIHLIPSLSTQVSTIYGNYYDAISFKGNGFHYICRHIHLFYL